jgi:hypothetical protein
MEVYLGSTKATDAALSAVFRRAVDAAKAAGFRHVALTVPTASAVAGLPLQDVLGPAQLGRLQRDQALGLGAITVYLSTPRIALRHRGPVIAAATARAHTGRLLMSPLVSHLFYVPRTESDVMMLLRHVPFAYRF